MILYSIVKTTITKWCNEKCKIVYYGLYFLILTFSMHEICSIKFCCLYWIVHTKLNEFIITNSTFSSESDSISNLCDTNCSIYKAGPWSFLCSTNVHHGSREYCQYHCITDFYVVHVMSEFNYQWHWSQLKIHSASLTELLELALPGSINTPSFFLMWLLKKPK